MEKEVKDQNSITIHGWMINKLQLRGNELLVYAVIYCFSQAGEHFYYGSLQHLSEWTNSTKRSVCNNLDSLLEKEYIFKEEKIVNGVKYCSYKANMEKISIPMKNFQWCGKNFNGTENISTNNNKDINNIIEKENIYLKEKDKPSRHKYGVYGRVLLSDIEYERLCNEFGVDRIDRQIELLDEYIESNNNKNKYTNFNLVLRKSIKDNWFNVTRTTTSSINRYEVCTDYDDLV